MNLEVIQLQRASLVAQTVKNLSAMRETWVQSLGCEDPLKEGMANHSSILAWRLTWTEEPWGRKESDMTEQLRTAQLYQMMNEFIIFTRV